MSPAKNELEEFRELLGDQVQLLLDTICAMGDLCADPVGLRKAKTALLERLLEIVFRHGLHSRHRVN